MVSGQKAEITAFIQALEAEAEIIAQFIDRLQVEQTALSSGNTDELPVIAEQKNTLAVHLSSFATQRNATLAAEGLAADRPGVEAWCAKHPDGKNAANVWRKILSLAEKARELNRLNGELIQIRLNYNAKALDALRRNEHTLNLYGPDGQSSSPGSRRINDAA